MGSHGAMDMTLAQIESIASNLSISNRRSVVEALRSLAAKLEDPDDAVFRILHSPYQLALAQTAVNSGLFRLLAEANRPLHIAEIRALIGGDYDMHARLCKAMASWRLIEETSKDNFAASRVTRAFTEPAYEAGLAHHFYLINNTVQALPDHLEETHYTVPRATSSTAFACVSGSSQRSWDWVTDHPFEMENFLTFMTYQDKCPVKWASVIPWTEYIRDSDSERVLFVEVGGVTGSQAVEFKNATAGVSGRIVVQNIQKVVEKAPNLDGVDWMTADYFNEQPIRDANFYYLSQVLNNNVESDSVKIVRNIKDAMGPDSVLIIDNVLMAEERARVQVTSQDLVMLSHFGGAERTESQWYAFIEKKCGLRIKNIRRYDSFMDHGIIECVRPDAASMGIS